MVYASTLHQGEKAIVVAYHSETDKLKMYSLGMLPNRYITVFSNQDGDVILYTTRFAPKVGIPKEIASHLEVILQ